jgi:hypothetical protein
MLDKVQFGQVVDIRDLPDRYLGLIIGNCILSAPFAGRVVQRRFGGPVFLVGVEEKYDCGLPPNFGSGLDYRNVRVRVIGMDVV